MTSWPIWPLGSKVRFLSGGTPRKDEPRFWGGEIPWVSSAEMVQSRIRDTELHVTEDGAKKGTRLVPAKTVLVVVRGMSLAKDFRVALAERKLTFNQDLKALLPTKDLDPTFLFYYLRSQNTAIRDSASEAAHGTKKLDMPVLEQWPLPLPLLDVQQKIAAILSAYDDLIENNRRRIALLEKMAEEIYREWFVRMRFPGHKQAKFKKGMPEGWDKKKLPDVAKITYGFPFQGDRFNTVRRGNPIIRIRNIPTASTQDFTDEVVDEKYVVKKGDFLVGMDGEFHMNHWQCNNAYLVQRTCRIKATDPLLAGYLAQALKAPIKHYQSILLGATVGHLGAKHLNSIDVLVPPAPLHSELKTLNDLLCQKIALSSQSKILSSTRNVLLPRLISGKLSVEKLDILLPPSVLSESEVQEPQRTHA